MKFSLRVLISLICCVFVLSTMLAFAVPAKAQDGDGDSSAWGEILNPDGSINWANLTYMGETSEPAEWMNVELPGGIQVPLGEATYNRYVTPSGNVLVLPSPATLLMTFVSPVESGLAANPPEMLGSGASILAMLASDYVDVSYLQTLGYVDPADFFQAVIDGRESIWSVVSPNFLIEIINMSQDAGYWVSALWLYTYGMDCNAIPGGCPPGFSLTPTPGIPGTPPASGPCPGPSLAFGDVSVAGRKVAPPNPIVVGQDPERRGVDVELRVTIPPVVFTWYEAQTREICEFSPGRDGSGCPAPGDQYDEVIGEDGESADWVSSMANNAYWQASSQTECLQHIEIFPDYLDAATLNINLTPGSRSWILTGLARAYPGASLKKPDWAFSFVGPGGLGSESLVFWSQLIPSIQLADPGVYSLRLSGRTTGTLVSSPRAFVLPLDELQVELLRVTLVEAP